IRDSYIAWCFLACSPPPANDEAGALALYDPRVGNAQTAMPGLPWGRQILARSTPGVYVAVPGWLHHSVIPMEPDQYAVVAIATAR
ncbi:hypothetical protein ACSNOI_25835, partial [Actinomadura kijaniata]|uniref:hypothetical protein n=1 Tax=Actinomadura kijaniata TaxID=46161 RepID=UPI003F1A8FDC